jgi:predicted enzyme related to lactoylglutathione lyase
MPERQSYEPGTPSWTDLSTTDVDAAKRFYADLFGWSYDAQDAGNGMIYTMAQQKAKAVAAIAPQPQMMAAAGAPPMWNTYVTVADVDASTGEVEGAGGAVLMPPMDVMDAGRMAVANDPTGAMFAMWQAKNNIGAELVNEHGALTWNELQTPDVDAAVAFYSKLFGWKSTAMDMGGGATYTMLELGDRGIGGAMKPPMEGIPAHWQVYFAVDDCDATVATAKKGGGTVLAEPMDLPDVGRMAALADPQGAAFSVIKNANEPT